jgi:hypothetical protein
MAKISRKTRSVFGAGGTLWRRGEQPAFRPVGTSTRAAGWRAGVLLARSLRSPPAVGLLSAVEGRKKFAERALRSVVSNEAESCLSWMVGRALRAPGSFGVSVFGEKTRRSRKLNKI